jgi:hypothetical protein
MRADAYRRVIDGLTNLDIPEEYKQVAEAVVRRITV